MIDSTTESKDAVELPAPTAWPLVLGLGIALVGAGLATNLGFLVVGGFVFFFSLGGWIGQLMSSTGHVREPRIGVNRRPIPTAAAPAPWKHSGPARLAIVSACLSMFIPFPAESRAAFSAAC